VPAELLLPTDLTPVLVRFVRRVREAGVDATPDRVHAFVEALDVLGAGDPVTVIRAGRLTLCADPIDLARFDAVAEAVFGGRDRPGPPSTGLQILRALLDDQPRPDDVGEDEDDDQLDEVDTFEATASRTERLRHADIAGLAPDERADLHRLLAAFRLPGEVRRTRRHRTWHRGTLARRATVRAVLAAGGEPAVLRHQRQRQRARDVVVLADVSGSMAAFAEAFLRFAHAASRAHPGDTEVFTLGTRLTRVTRELSLRDPDMALRAVGRTVPDWSGGTRLGEGMREFLDVWGQRGTARGAVVVVLSDGWELGDTTLLRDQTARLARLAHRVVWANPRAGREGFTPTASGMVAVLPSCDALLPANTLAALEHVAAVVAGATHRRDHRGGPHA
jgi:hypothetical protein